MESLPGLHVEAPATIDVCAVASPLDGRSEGDDSSLSSPLLPDTETLTRRPVAGRQKIIWSLRRTRDSWGICV